MAMAIDDYIAEFPQAAQVALQAVRRTLAAAMPDADEMVSYGIPTFKRNGSYVAYFAEFKRHVSIYPLTTCPDFEEELAPYRSGRATVKFPLDAPMPLDLIARIAAFLAAEHDRRTNEKQKQKGHG